ncbi:unnamed protein product [Schistosoma intercalatum]|nr:unnamed protein product [Schistosoma intercalatum]CAH8620042.1 unnamed protein product [Schistosoma intercalatum]
MNMLKIPNTALLFFDYFSTGTFFILLIYLFTRLCTHLLHFPSLNCHLDVIIYQSRAVIIFLVVFVYFVGVLTCKINDKFLVYTMLRNRRRLNTLLYTLVLFTFALCSLCSVIFVPYTSFAIFLLSTSVFLLFSDLSIFLIVLEYYLLETELLNYQHAKRHCLLSHLFSNQLFVDHILGMFLKTSLFSISITSKYAYLESIFKSTLMEQIIYIVIIFVFLPSFMRIFASYAKRVCGKQQKCLVSNKWVSSSTRKRRHSYSSGHSYVEYRRMNIHNLSGYDVNPNRSDKCWSTTFMVFVSLIILHLNNRYSERISSFKHNSSENEVFPILYNVTAYEVTSIFRFIYNILHVINVNMVVYLFLGLLLFKRIRLNKPTNSQLRNLNIPKIKETLLSDQVKQSPEFSKKLNDVPLQSRRRIYCLRKDDDYIDKNDSSSVSTFSNTCKNVSERSSNVLDLDMLTEKIKQGLGHELSDTEILQLISHGRLKTRELESVVRNPFRAVELRRLDLSTFLNNPHIIERIPYKDYDYRLVYGQCCEEVIGYMPIPVGKIGPLLLDGRSHYIPLATTEGCLVASTNRGCRAIFLAGGIKSVVYRDQMTRAPVVWFPSIIDSVKCIAWIDSDEGFQILKSAFDKTSAHVNLLSVFACPAGRYIHIRFAARTGDAMGMNMVSKATDSALHCLQKYFSNMQVISLSGNMCTDKKPATINTILGRGKSVIAEAHLSADVLAQVLHTNAQRLARLTHSKNWIGSAMAGCPGMMGCNAHAANIIAGMFAATGQDLAQVVDSSSCLTQLEVDLSDDSLVASVTMPCLEVGTVGGGTRLPGQRACLDLLDLSVDRPTEHLSRIIAGTVLAAELSLMAALDTDDLVKAHMHFNRAKQSTNSNSCSHSTTADYNNNDNNSNIYDNHSIALSSKSSVTDNSDVRESVHSIHVKPLPVKSDLSVNSVISHYTM